MITNTNIMIRVSQFAHAWGDRHPGMQFVLSPYSSDRLNSLDLLYLVSRVSQLEATIAAKDAEIMRLRVANKDQDQ